MWAADTLHDTITDGRHLCILTVGNEASKACLARSLRALDASIALERMMTVQGPPARVRSDNGLEQGPAGPTDWGWSD